MFHPDYTYSDFVGQIMPRVENGAVSYSFMPGPFTKLLKKAYEHPETEYFLIIEEINRGNAPAIFGDVFQLLDRKAVPDESGFIVGTSEYGITNENIAFIVYGDGEHAAQKSANPGKTPAPIAEHILICLSAAPSNPRVIRTAACTAGG